MNMTHQQNINRNIVILLPESDIANFILSTIAMNRQNIDTANCFKLRIAVGRNFNVIVIFQSKPNEFNNDLHHVFFFKLLS